MTTHENFLSNIENVPAHRSAARWTAASERWFRCRCFMSPAATASSCRAARAAAPPSSCRAFDVQAFLRAIGEERINSRDFRSGDFLAGDQPAEFLRDRHQRRPLGDVRRRADRSGSGGPHSGRVSERARRQRIRPHRDFLGRHFPSARICAGAAGFGGLRGAGDRSAICSSRIRAASASCWCAVRNVVKGYWNKPEATAQTFVNGWLHTGDLARIDADGFVQIVDRKKDMVNRGGENVYCVEVENALVRASGRVRVRGDGRAGHDDGRKSRSGYSTQARLESPTRARSANSLRAAWRISRSRNS